MPKDKQLKERMKEIIEELKQDGRRVDMGEVWKIYKERYEK